MAMYATPSELASHLQKDLDTASATQALTLVSSVFSAVADTWWTPTSVTWTTDVDGCLSVALPFFPVTAVSAVRVNGSTITGWSLRNGTIYRAAGFGYRYSWPVDYAEVDLTHGYTTAPDDVKQQILASAALVYENPNGLWSETIDDYSAVYPGSRSAAEGPLTGTALALARLYRGIPVN